MKKAVSLLLAALLLTAGVAAAQSGENEKKDEEEPGILDHIRTMYETAKEAGEQVPEDIYDWARDDIGKIGSWEYQVVLIPRTAGIPAMEKRLNKLGAERWECYWVEKVPDGHRMYFKRPSRSYLKSVPVSDMLKLLPLGGDDGDRKER